ncbi:2-oxoacid dehydrogenases acyltransferase-domain-containing protein [Aspergillus unguis]
MTSLARRSIASVRGFNQPGRGMRLVNSAFAWPTGRHFLHGTALRSKIQPYLLADIGEGITECRVVQWFVKPGDAVGQFDAICEVQSDKASVEISSRYDGVVKTLHHAVDEIATVGKPLLDIDVKDDDEGDAHVTSAEDAQVAEKEAPGPKPESESASSPVKEEHHAPHASAVDPPPDSKSGHAVPAVPAVRRMLKEHGLDIQDIQGTGKGGRVMKEDVQRYLESQTTSERQTDTVSQSAALDTPVTLTPIESQMFKVMTSALSIPHFGYTHSVDLTITNTIRQKYNASRESMGETLEKPAPKLTFLPIIMKAISLAFQKHQRLNAHLHLPSDQGEPSLVLKGTHDFGIAVDTPKGLLVPVVRGVQNRSITSIAEEISRLSNLAKQGALKPSDFRGATFTVSNIGSIGGNAVSPVIVPPMVGIVGVGKVDDVATFIRDEHGNEQLVKRQKTVLSWSADHRVLDGASVARCAESVSTILENVDGVSLALM